MKLSNNWHTAVILFLLPVFFLAACKKSNTEQFNKPTPTLFQYISAGKQFTLYQAALKRAGMYNAETFSNNGPFTVFAPVDSALVRAGLTLDSINRFDPQALASILKYNMVSGTISSNSLIGFYSEDVNSLNTTYLPRITKNYYGIFFDGIPLIPGGSIDLNDGTLHELQRMAFPPSTNIYTLLSKTPDLTFYAAALKLIGYDTKLSVPPPPNPYVTGDARFFYTLFAPTNDAFIKFGFADLASINNADPSYMLSLITQWQFPGKMLTSGFKGGYSLFQDAWYIDVDGFTILSQGNVAPTYIIRPDVLATNGVIQVVDQVMVPR